MKLSIKKPNGMLWKTDYDHARIQSELASGAISEDWLVCPLGSASEAISIKEYLLSPDSLVQENAENVQEAAVSADSAPSVMKFGWMVFLVSLSGKYILSLLLASSKGSSSLAEMLFYKTLDQVAFVGICGGILTLLFGQVRNILLHESPAKQGASENGVAGQTPSRDGVE